MVAIVITSAAADRAEQQLACAAPRSRITTKLISVVTVVLGHTGPRTRRAAAEKYARSRSPSGTTAHPDDHALIALVGVRPGAYAEDEHDHRRGREEQPARRAR